MKRDRVTAAFVFVSNGSHTSGTTAPPATHGYSRAYDSRYGIIRLFVRSSIISFAFRLFSFLALCEWLLDSTRVESSCSLTMPHGDVIFPFYCATFIFRTIFFWFFIFFLCDFSLRFAWRTCRVVHRWKSLASLTLGAPACLGFHFRHVAVTLSNGDCIANDAIVFSGNESGFV